MKAAKSGEGISLGAEDNSTFSNALMSRRDAFKVSAALGLGAFALFAFSHRSSPAQRMSSIEESLKEYLSLSNFVSSSLQTSLEEKRFPNEHEKRDLLEALEGSLSKIQTIRAITTNYFSAMPYNEAFADLMFAFEINCEMHDFALLERRASESSKYEYGQEFDQQTFGYSFSVLNKHNRNLKEIAVNPQNLILINDELGRSYAVLSSLKRKIE